MISFLFATVFNLTKLTPIISVLNPGYKQHSSPVFCGQRLRRRFGKLRAQLNENKIAIVFQLDGTSPLQFRSSATRIPSAPPPSLGELSCAAQLNSTTTQQLTQSSLWLLRMQFDIQEVDPPSASGATVGVEDVSTARDNAGEEPPNLRGAGLRTSVGLTCIHRGGACNLQTTCCSTGGQLNYCHFGKCCKLWWNFRIEC